MRNLGYLLLFLLLFLLPLFYSCDKKDVDVTAINEGQERNSIVDNAEWLTSWPPADLTGRVYSGKEVAKRRALQMASIRWTPKLSSIPSRYGVYAINSTYTGLPYSLAIKTDSHIGTQVSLYTFMTAVDNPFSVLYTEDLREAPYNGFDCAPYYGTTCSNSVLFALGIDAPYYTYMIRSIPGIVKPKGQSPDDVEDCDLLLKSGHVVMVYEVERNNDGNLTSVRIFETTSVNQKDTWIRSFSADEFREYWTSNQYVRLQYSLIDLNTDYEPSMFVPLEDEPGVNNYSPLLLCTTRGDRASYLEGQAVDIAVISDQYRWVLLCKNDEEIETREIERPVIRFSDLSYGLYKAFLIATDGRRSHCYTSFEVINANATGEKGRQISINFTSENASARYLCICDDIHNPYKYLVFNDSDRESGHFETALLSGIRSTSYKVYFKGQYGIVSTELKHFN